MFEGFAKLHQSLTTVVFLRRISRELRRANDLAEARLSLEHPQWYKSSPIVSLKSKVNTLRPTKLSDLGTPSIEDWNRTFLENHPPQSEQDDEAEYDIT